MSHNKSNVFGVVVLAAAIGAALGVLLAPKRGSDTRDDLKNKYNDMKNKTQDKAHQAKDKLDEGIEKARSKAHDVADKSHDVIDDTARKARKATDDLANKTTISDEILAEHEKRNRPKLT